MSVSKADTTLGKGMKDKHLHTHQRFAILMNGKRHQKASETSALIRLSASQQVVASPTLWLAEWLHLVYEKGMRKCAQEVGPHISIYWEEFNDKGSRQLGCLEGGKSTKFSSNQTILVALP